MGYLDYVSAYQAIKSEQATNHVDCCMKGASFVWNISFYMRVNNGTVKPLNDKIFSYKCFYIFSDFNVFYYQLTLCDNMSSASQHHCYCQTQKGLAPTSLTLTLTKCNWFLDIDECSKGTHTCDLSQSTCENTVGSFRCSCKTGFTQGSTDQICGGMWIYGYMWLYGYMWIYNYHCK